MIVGVIPARYASSRLPGKPLANIGGKPMIQWVHEQASRTTLLDKVIIATDDERIYDVCRSFGAEVRITSKDIRTGSDRIAEVVRNLTEVKIVVNIQGDEPFIPPQMIDQAIEPLLFEPDVEVATLMRKITAFDELQSPSVVKVVYDYRNFALYFSRSVIPHVRDAAGQKDRILSGVFYKHIGLYVYRRDTLLRFTKMPQTDLESLEKLEQLRMLENGINIKVVETDLESLSVDNKQDLEAARRYFESHILKG